jgi:sec-independent protein translocase protein TatA
MGLSVGEIIVIAFVLVVIFSASRMSALGNALGKFVYSFRKAAKGQDLIDVNPRPLRRSPRSEDEPADKGT